MATNMTTAMTSPSPPKTKKAAAEKRKRKHSIRSVWNAIMYVVKTGCQWRMLPSNFAKWQLVYYYYRKWIQAETFDIILDKLRAKARVNRGQQGLQVILRTETVKNFKPVAKRWVVERTFAWFDNDRRLCRNYELLMESSEEIVKLSAIKLLLNKF